jgi:hypothetical protein
MSLVAIVHQMLGTADNPDRVGAARPMQGIDEPDKGVLADRCQIDPS